MAHKWRLLVVVALGTSCIAATANAQVDPSSGEPAVDVPIGSASVALVAGPAAVEPFAVEPLAAGTITPDPRPLPIALLAGGVAMLASGYVGSVVWGSYFFADRQLGVLSCNDSYAGWHFLPLAGPVIGMLAGGDCIPDTLHAEEAIVPVVLSGLQLAGIVLTILGVLQRDRRSVPAVSVSVETTGGRIAIAGAF